MKPRGPLMIEHRLIEKMLKITNQELEIIKQTREVNPAFIETIVDFIKMYADRTHHGKEEDILFKELKNKNINRDDRIIMEQLIEEHIIARRVVTELVEANIKYNHGNKENITTIIQKLSFLIKFYQDHIKKEDVVFFPNAEKYFSDNELAGMLNQFWEFDRKMIHEKYNKLCESLSKKYTV